MKKMFIPLIAIALSVATVSMVDARLTKAEQQRIATEKAQSTAREITEKAAAVRDDVKNVKANPTPKAMEEARMSVENLLASLHERTWSGDLAGYTEDQKIAAGMKLEALEAQKTNLLEEIKSTKDQLEEMTDKGWFWNSRKKDIDEEEFNDVKKTLADLHVSLKNVNKAIANQSVIAGKAYARAIKMAVGATFAAATAGVIYLTDVYKFDSAGKAYLVKKAGEAYEYAEEVTRPMRGKMAAGYEYVKGRFGRKPAPVMKEAAPLSEAERMMPEQR